MAHDINNPAGAINMAIDALYNIDDEEKKKEALDIMKNCIKRIINIANSTLNQIKNFGSTVKQKFTIKDFMKEIETNSDIINRLTESNCSLKVLINNDIELYGERLKLNQVITNMITNSILCYQEINKTGEIIVKLSQDDKYHTISVEDEAGGIPEEVQKVLLKDIFTTRGTKGTGVGLYLGNIAIQESFGGEITFDTQVRKGNDISCKIFKKYV